MNKIIISLLFSIVSLISYSQDSIVFSHVSGHYNSSFYLKITSKYNKLLYTTDGSKPNYNSNTWHDSILIDNNFILRIRVLDGNKLLDKIKSHFYLFNFNKKLPIASIAMDNKDLWNEEKGIYVKGSNTYLDSLGKEINCNYKKNWEREVNFIYIENNKTEINQSCGIKIFGETTRVYPEKSLRIIAREKYGKNKFKHNFFDLKKNKKHKHLVFRTSGNDFLGTRFKDVLSAYLIRNLDVDFMDYKAVHLFVNAEYWGLYNLREKINEHYLKYNHKLDKDSVSIMMGRWVRQQGRSSDFLTMYNWFHKTKHIDSIAYLQANKFLDIRNYINFRIFQIFINNLDSRGNIRYWNSFSETSDKKFRMILYDTDQAYGLAYDRKFLQHSLSNNHKFWYNPNWSTEFLRKLMTNKDFKNEFLVQYAHLLNTSLNKDTLLSAINHFKDLYIGELPRKGDVKVKHLKNLQLSEERWIDKVNKLIKFANNRYIYVKEELVSLLAPSAWFFLEIKSQEGKVKINNNYSQCLPFKGEYLKDTKFTIEALNDGYFTFSHWSDGDSSRIRIINHIKADSLKLEAIYILKEPKINNHTEQKIKEEITELKKNNYILYLGYFLMIVGVGLISLGILKNRL